MQRDRLHPAWIGTNLVLSQKGEGAAVRVDAMHADPVRQLASREQEPPLRNDREEASTSTPPSSSLNR